MPDQPTPKYLIWSQSLQEWYRDPSGGTTRKIDEAHRYERGEAQAIQERYPREQLIIIPAPRDEDQRRERKSLGLLILKKLFDQNDWGLMGEQRRNEFDAAANAVRDAVLDVPVEEMAKVISKAYDKGYDDKGTWTDIARAVIEWMKQRNV